MKNKSKMIRADSELHAFIRKNKMEYEPYGKCLKRLLGLKHKDGGEIK